MIRPIVYIDLYVTCGECGAEMSLDTVRVASESTAIRLARRRGWVIRKDIGFVCTKCQKTLK